MADNPLLDDPNADNQVLLQGVDPKIQQAWDSGLLGALGFTQNEGILSGPASWWYAGSSLPQATTSSGMPVDVYANPLAAGPTGALQELLTNQSAQGATVGENAPTDPRVDEFYAANPNASVADMWAAIPDAGRGSFLGGVGTLHQNATNQARQAGTDIAQAHSPWVGEDLPSTNNWRVFPSPWRRPGMIMRNGVLIDTTSPGFRAGYDAFTTAPYADDFGQNHSPINGVYSPHLGPYGGYPASYGFAGIHYGWPGSVTPWNYTPTVLP